MSNGNVEDHPGTENMRAFIHQEVNKAIEGKSMHGSSGGGGDDSGLEARVSKLEAHMEHLREDVSEVKTTLSTIDDKLDKKFTKTWIGIFIAFLIGMAALAWMFTSLILPLMEFLKETTK